MRHPPGIHWTIGDTRIESWVPCGREEVPLGQPKKALGHEPQIDLCVANQATTRLASFANRSTSCLLNSRCSGDGTTQDLRQDQRAENPNPTARITNRGWKSRTRSPLPVEGEKCP